MSITTRTLTIEQLDEINDIQHYLSALTNLMIPSDDLHLVNRDNLAILLGFFLERLSKVTEGAAALSIEQLDEINEIQRCLSAVADLIAPCSDLHIVDRNNLAMLIGYFSNRLRELAGMAV